MKNKLNKDEQFRYDTIKDLVENNGNKKRAALLLGVSPRHINRMIKGYNDEGEAYFIHGNRNRKPVNAMSDETRKRIVSLYREKYYDASFAFFTELLKENEDICISESSVRNILEENGIYSPRMTRPRKKRMKKEMKEKQKEASQREADKIQKNLVSIEDAHPRKPRMKYFGEQIQMDASPHKWFGDKVTYLHTAIDDSTSRLVAAWFDEQETLNGYYHILYQILTGYGIPFSFQTDRRTVFDYRSRHTDRLEEDTFTQFSYACARLGIEIRCSSVPQKKARVERAYGTLQQRLPIHLRLAGITDIDSANEFLGSYIEKYNAKFALPIDSTKNVFETQPDEKDIILILSVLSERVVDAGHCIKKNRKHYRMVNSKGEPVYYYKGTRVTVIEAYDGNLYCVANNSEVLKLEEVEEYEKESENFDFKEEDKNKDKDNDREIEIPEMSTSWDRENIDKFIKTMPHRIEEEIKKY